MKNSFRINQVSGNDLKLYYLINTSIKKSCIEDLTNEQLILEKLAPKKDLLQNSDTCCFFNEFSHKSFLTDLSVFPLCLFSSQDLKERNRHSPFRKKENYTKSIYSSINIDLNPYMKSTLKTIKDAVQSIVSALKDLLLANNNSALENEITLFLRFLSDIMQTYSHLTFKRIQVDFQYESFFLFPFHKLPLPYMLHDLVYKGNYETLLHREHMLLAKFKKLQNTRAAFMQKVISINANEDAFDALFSSFEYQALMESCCQFIAHSRESKKNRTFDNISDDFFFNLKPSAPLIKLLSVMKTDLFQKLHDRFLNIFSKLLSDNALKKFNKIFYNLSKLEIILFEKFTDSIKLLGLEKIISEENIQIPNWLELPREDIETFCKYMFEKNPLILLFSAGLINTYKSNEGYNNFCLGHDFMISELTKRTIGSHPFEYIY